MEWIKCSERMPEPGVEVLVWIDGHRGPAWSNNHALVAYRSAISGHWLQERHERSEPLIGVTHWMPLPEPPSD